MCQSLNWVEDPVGPQVARFRHKQLNENDIYAKYVQHG